MRRGVYIWGEGISLKIFKIIRQVLDETYHRVPGDSPGKKDALVTRRIKELSSRYHTLTKRGRQPIDYSKPSVRFAYLYAYLFARADSFYQILAAHPQVSGKLAHDKSLRITSIGAGPGSEVLGLVKLAKDYGRTSALRCHLCDREKAWKKTWQKLAEASQIKFSLDAKYVVFDATDESTYLDLAACLKADIFIFSYFVSEVVAFKSEAIDFLNYLANAAKSGAIFIFVDNNDSRFFASFADEFATKHRFERIDEGAGVFKPSPDEQKYELGDYTKRFEGRLPHLTIKVDFRLWCKR